MARDFPLSGYRFRPLMATSTQANNLLERFLFYMVSPHIGEVSTTALPIGLDGAEQDAVLQLSLRQNFLAAPEIARRDANTAPVPVTSSTRVTLTFLSERFAGGSSIDGQTSMVSQRDQVAVGLFLDAHAVVDGRMKTVWR